MHQLQLTDDVEAFLRGHHVMTLATQGEQGPWAAALFYACDVVGELELVHRSSFYGSAKTLS